MPEKDPVTRIEFEYLKNAVHKIEANLGRVVWLIISSVAVGVLDLVIRSRHGG